MLERAANLFMQNITISSLATLTNLNLAWQRIRTGDNVAYKSFYREQVDAYSLSINSNLRDLSTRLRDGTYIPQVPDRIMLAKANGLLRPYTLLTIEDQIVYQAYGNLLRNLHVDRRRPLEATGIYSNHFSDNAKSPFLFKPNYFERYSAFDIRRSNLARDPMYVIADYDLAAFYDTISHELVLDLVGTDDRARRLLKDALAHWTPEYVAHGIPQGPIASSLIAECVLLRVDEDVLSSHGGCYLRYVDDMVLAAKNVGELQCLIVKLDKICRGLGFVPNSSKHKAMSRRSNPASSGKAKPRLVSAQTTATAIRMSTALPRVISVFYSTLNRPRNRVENPTLYRSVMFRSRPTGEVWNVVLKLLRVHPELIDAHVAYLSRFEQSVEISSCIVKLLRRGTPYANVEGQYWTLLAISAPQSAVAKMVPLALQRIHDTANNDSFLKIGLYRFLARSDDVSALDIAVKQLITQESAIVLSNVVALFIKREVGSANVDALLYLCVTHSDGAVGATAIAASIIANYNFRPSGLALKAISRVAHRTMHSLGMFRHQTLLGLDPIATLLNKRYCIRAKMDWNRLLGPNYKAAHRLLLMADLEFESASAWLGILDSFNDMLVRASCAAINALAITSRPITLVDRNGAEVKYGNLLATSAPLATLNPRMAKAFRDLHYRRNYLPTSHPKQTGTGLPAKVLDRPERQRCVSTAKVAYSELAKVFIRHGYRR